MADIYAGFAIIGLTALFCFWTGLRLGRRTTSRAHINLLAVVIIVAILGYVRYLWYDVRLVRLLPFSNLIVVGNWLPLAAGLLAGLAWSAVPGSLWRRSLPVASLAAAGGYAMLAPVLGRSPRCDEQWTSRGFCVQTTMHTCSPACAASLLRMHGIGATEQEMAELCLTRFGTSWMGLYRGLKQKTEHSCWTVQVVKCDWEHLRQPEFRPMILTVGLDETSETDPSFRDEHGWIPGVDHSVILLDHSPGSGLFEIDDPAPGIGREFWSSRELNCLWRGYGLQLVKRQ